MPRRWEEAARFLADPPKELDLVEIRLDRLGQAIPAGLLGGRNVRVAAACRRVRDGGESRLDEADRLRILLESARNGADLVDVELDAAGRLPALDRARAIVSFHGPAGTPDVLDEVVRSAAGFSPRFIKVVSFARTLTDSLRLLRLPGRHSGLSLTAFCMGERGRLSRALAPRFGSVIHYVALKAGDETAPGQYTLAEWTAQLPPEGIGKGTTLYGLLGNPLGHSASPRLQNAYNRALGIDAAYLPMECDEVAEGVEVAASLGFRGLNVTAPFKETVRDHLGSEGPSARRFGAVNVLCAMSRHGPWAMSHENPPSTHGAWRMAHGSSVWKGFNTDVPAFLKSLRGTLGRDWPRGRRILLLGAGGGGVAIARGLAAAEGRVFLSARDPARLAEAAARAGAVAVPWAARQDFQGDLVVNATPIGTRSAESPIHDNVFKQVKAAADLVYNPPLTRMLEAATWHGCAVVRGTGMLREQAARSFRLWTGRRAPVDHAEVRKRCADIWS